MREFEAGLDTLFRQAPLTADEYLAAAIERIDARLGEGYACRHPELIGAFMQTCALDLAGAILGRKLEDLTETIESFSSFFERDET